jgi:hypothetical protein
MEDEPYRQPGTQKWGPHGAYAQLTNVRKDFGQTVDSHRRGGLAGAVLVRFANLPSYQDLIRLRPGRRVFAIAVALRFLRSRPSGYARGSHAGYV